MKSASNLKNRQLCKSTSKHSLNSSYSNVGCSSVCMYKRLAMLSSLHRWQPTFLHINQLLTPPKQGSLRRTTLSTMNKFWYGITYSIALGGTMSIIFELKRADKILEPEILLGLLAFFLIMGYVWGIIIYDRKREKEIEEEERRAQQDRTNELARKYLEMKLREEKNKKQTP